MVGPYSTATSRTPASPAVNRQHAFRSQEAAQEYCGELNAQRHKAVAASPSELRKSTEHRYPESQRSAQRGPGGRRVLLGDQAPGYFAPPQYFEGLAGAVKPRYAR